MIFGLLVCLDTVSVTFEGQGHRSKSKVTGGNVAVVGVPLDVFFVTSV